MGTLCVSENESQLDNPEWETKEMMQKVRVKKER